MQHHTKTHTEAFVKTRQKKFIASMSALTFETQKEKLNDTRDKHIKAERMKRIKLENIRGSQ